MHPDLPEDNTGAPGKGANENETAAPESVKTENSSSVGSRAMKHLRRAVLIAGGAAVLSAVATEIMFLVMFGRTKPVLEEPFPLADWAAEHKLSWTEIAFPSGENTLRGYLISGPQPRALIIIAHGMNGSSDEFEPVVRFFAERNYATLIFDGTASARSDGQRVAGLQQPRCDVRAAVEYVKKNCLDQGVPLVLLGHSAGSYGVAAEAEASGAAAVVCVSGFDTPLGTMHHWGRTYASILGDIEYPFLMAHEYSAHGRDGNVSAAKALASSGVHCLIIHGAKDDAVPLKISIYEKLGALHCANAEFYLEEASEHNNHAEILATKDGQANTPLLERIEAFIAAAIENAN